MQSDHADVSYDSTPEVSGFLELGNVLVFVQLIHRPMRTSCTKTQTLLNSRIPDTSADILTYEDVHAVFVKVIEKVCLLRLVDAGEHVLRVEECAYDAHELDGAAHFGVRVADHLLDYHVHQ